jgi:hypothetical protein
MNSMSPGGAMAVFFRDFAAIVALGIGLAILIKWLERKTRVPGLAAILLGTVMLLAAVTALVSGRRLLPIVFVLFAIRYLYEGAGPVLTHVWRSRR